MMLASVKEDPIVKIEMPPQKMQAMSVPVVIVVM